MKQFGFIPVLMVILIALGVGGYLIYQKSQAPKIIPPEDQVVCIQDVKLCPDGTSVGRSGPKCDFALCPSPAQSNKTCKATGCGGTICAENEVISTCILRPGDTCYKKALCGRQVNGKCGWTKTKELTLCLQTANSNECETDKDCQNNYMCTQAGPDQQGVEIPKKCWPKNAVLPL